jgi:hypothetical protein
MWGAAAVESECRRIDCPPIRFQCVPSFRPPSGVLLRVLLPLGAVEGLRSSAVCRYVNIPPPIFFFNILILLYLSGAVRGVLLPLGAVGGAAAVPRPLGLTRGFGVADTLGAQLEHAGARVCMFVRTYVCMYVCMYRTRDVVLPYSYNTPSPQVAVEGTHYVGFKLLLRVDSV